MIRNESQDNAFVGLVSRLRSSMENYLRNLKNSQVMLDLRKTHKDINNPAISIFLAVLIVAGFSPFCVYIPLIIGCILVFAFVVLIIVIGGFMAVILSVLASSLAIFSPTLMFVGAVTFFVYLAYSFVASTLRKIKELKKGVIEKPPIVRILSDARLRCDDFDTNLRYYTKSRSRLRWYVDVRTPPRHLYRQTRR